MAEYTPKHMPGASFTSQASGTITAGQLLIISGDGTVAAASAAAATVVGVAGNDAGSGDKVTVYRGGVQRVKNTGGVTAGQTLEAATAGTCATHTNGTNDAYIFGKALSTATTGNLVDVVWID